MIKGEFNQERPLPRDLYLGTPGETCEDRRDGMRQFIRERPCHVGLTDPSESAQGFVRLENAASDIWTQ